MFLCCHRATLSVTTWLSKITWSWLATSHVNRVRRTATFVVINGGKTNRSVKGCGKTQIWISLLAHKSISQMKRESSPNRWTVRQSNIMWFHKKVSGLNKRPNAKIALTHRVRRSLTQWASRIYFLLVSNLCSTWPNRSGSFGILMEDLQAPNNLKITSPE